MPAAATRLPAAAAVTPGGAAPRPGLLACPECDALHRRRPLAGGEAARCVRCGALLARGERLGLQGQFALALAALIMLAIGNLAPLVTLDLRGDAVVLTLAEAIRQTWRDGEPLVAVLAAAVSIVFPLLLILLRLWVLAPMALVRRRAAGWARALRMLNAVTRWSMVEVFMFGALVAIVRSAGLVSVHVDAGLFAFAALALLLAANVAGGLDALWERAQELPA